MARREEPNPEHLELIKLGVEAWNAWRKENRHVNPFLRGASLSGIDLVGADLTGANLTNADLSAANLRSADLAGARLSLADLRNASLANANLKHADLMLSNLWSADFSGADLGHTSLASANLKRTDFTGADLSGAFLVDADLTDADLTRANFKNADLWDTHVHRVDLRRAEGLETVKHKGPSPISSQTLEMSKGQVPEIFLKGCGLKDWEVLGAQLHDPNLRQDEIIDISYRIAEIRGASPIIPLSVFISYSNKDMDFIEKLEAQFDKDGIRSWRDAKDMVAGPIEGQIDRSIRLQQVVLLVISKNSIRSDWVEWEVRKARELQKELQEKSDKTIHVLCPVAIDKAWWDSNPWPERLRDQVQEYNIVDLSQWEDHDVFEAQYEKLRKGLGIFYRNEIEKGEGNGS